MIHHSKKVTHARILASVILLFIFLVYVADYCFEKYRGTSTLYFCEEGILHARYHNDSVTVVTPSGEKFLLPIAPSASGVRYTEGGIVFWNKGDNAFVTKGEALVYSKCVSGTTRSVKKGTTLFKNSDETMSLSFPSNFSISGSDGAYTEDWKVHRAIGTPGKILLRISAPENFKPNTNLREAFLTIGASSDPEAIRTCALADDPGVKSTGLVLNKTGFTKLVFSDAGAGNLYQTTSYRTIHEGQCYAIEYTLHSLNLHNFPEEAHLTEFNKADVSREFDMIVNSFLFK